MSTPPFQLDDLFAQLVGAGPVALAVSGGADSMAMMHLFATWRQAHPLKNESHDGGQGDVVISVNHGLRLEAAEEVAFVLKAASELGFEGVGLRLAGLEKGRRVQVAARQGRYEAMANVLKARGLSALLTAHTLDDQAETVLMRLKRGSGLEGLRGILPVRQLFGITLYRPLLELEGAALRAYLVDRQINYVEDPSNQDESFERVQVRRCLSSFDGEGALTRGVATSARRLQGAFEGLSFYADDFFQKEIRQHPTGVMDFSSAAFHALPLMVQVMVLQKVLLSFGRGTARLSSLEGAVGALSALKVGGQFALKGVLFEKRKDASSGGLCYFLYRESGRAALPQSWYELKAGEVVSLLWDERIALEIKAARGGRVLARGFSLGEVEVVCQHLKSVKGETALSREMIGGVVSLWFYSSEGGQSEGGQGEVLGLRLPQLAPVDEALAIEALGVDGGQERQNVLQVALKAFLYH